jgi:hypothetical protein
MVRVNGLGLVDVSLLAVQAFMQVVQIPTVATAPAPALLHALHPI